jgi:hypothetical protein
MAHDLRAVRCVTAWIMDRIARFGRTRTAGFSTPLSPLLETCAWISRKLSVTAPCSLRLVWPGSCQSPQRLCFTVHHVPGLPRDVQDLPRHIEVTFKTKPAEDTIALWMGLATFAATATLAATSDRWGVVRCRGRRQGTAKAARGVFPDAARSGDPRTGPSLATRQARVGPAPRQG